MFGFFSYWKTCSIDEIKKGNYLNKAQKINYKEFFNKKTFKELNPWTILLVNEDNVYWSKSNEEKHINATFLSQKKDIEQNFAALYTTKKSLYYFVSKNVHECRTMIFDFRLLMK
jgi:hypothetical protein